MAKKYSIRIDKPRFAFYHLEDEIKMTAAGYINFYELIRALNHEEIHSLLYNMFKDHFLCRDFDYVAFSTYTMRIQDGSRVPATGDEYVYELQGEHDLTRIEEL